MAKAKKKTTRKQVQANQQKQLKGVLNTHNLRYRLILDPNGNGQVP